MHDRGCSMRREESKTHDSGCSMHHGGSKTDDRGSSKRRQGYKSHGSRCSMCCEGSKTPNRLAVASSLRMSELVRCLVGEKALLFGKGST